MLSARKPEARASAAEAPELLPCSLPPLACCCPGPPQRTELVEVQARAAAALEKQRQLAGGAGSSPAGDSAGGGDPALAGAGGGNPADPTAQPLLFYSVRSMQPGTQEPPPLAGPRVEEDPLPIQHDPAEKLTGQVNSVEAGRVHGWACLKGGAAAELAVSVYVDGVLAGRGQASLPTQTPAVRRLCQLDSGAGDSAAARAGQPHLGRDTSGVGFVVPLPPLPQGLHTVRWCRAEAGRAPAMPLRLLAVLCRSSPERWASRRCRTRA